jgi:hypothetical protein
MVDVVKSLKKLAAKRARIEALVHFSHGDAPDTLGLQIR